MNILNKCSNSLLIGKLMAPSLQNRRGSLFLLLLFSLSGLTFGAWKKTSEIPEAASDFKFSIHNFRLNNGGEYFKTRTLTLQYIDGGSTKTKIPVELKLDELKPFTVNSLPHTLTGLPEGQHVLKIFPGNKDIKIKDPVVLHFMIDTTSPVIDSVHFDLMDGAKDVLIRVVFSETMDTASSLMVNFANDYCGFRGWESGNTLRARYAVNLKELLDSATLYLGKTSDLAGNILVVNQQRIFVPSKLLLDYGLSVKNKGNLKEAYEAFTIAGMKAPLSLEARRNLISLLKKKKKYKALGRELKDLATLMPFDSAMIRELITSVQDVPGGLEGGDELLSTLTGAWRDEDTTRAVICAGPGEGLFVFLLDKSIDIPKTMNPDARYFMYQGGKLLVEGKGGAALKRFGSARVFDENDKVIDYGMALSLALEERYSEALDIFENLLKGAGLQYQGNYAAVLALAGRHQEAADVYAQCADCLKEPVHASNFGSLQHLLNNRDIAFENLEKAAIKMKTPGIMHNYACGLMARGFYARALKIFSRNTRSKGNIQLYSQAGRAHCLLKLGRQNESIFSMQKALSFNPRQPAVLAELGRLQAAAGLLTAARQNLEKAVEWCPNSHYAKESLVEVYQSQGDVNGAQDMAVSALRDRHQSKIKNPDAKVVAVLEFRPLVKDTALKWVSLAAAEAISRDMEALSPYKMLERTDIAKAISALELQDMLWETEDSAAYEDVTAGKVGPQLNKLSAAKAIVTGSFQGNKSMIRLDARLIDLESGKILNTASASGALKDLSGLERQIALKLAGMGDNAAFKKVSKPVSAEAQQKMAQAMEAVYKGDLKGASALSKEAMAIDPHVLQILNETMLVGEEDARGKLLAVLPFANMTGRDQDSWMCSGIQEVLITDLKKADLFMVERSQIGKVMEELDFSQTDLVDASKAPKIGKLLSAGVAIVGGFQAGGADLKIIARMVNVESGEVHLSTSVSGKLSNVLKLEEQLAFKIMEALHISVDNHQRAKILNKDPLALKTLQDNMQAEQGTGKEEGWEDAAKELDKKEPPQEVKEETFDELLNKFDAPKNDSAVKNFCMQKIAGLNKKIRDWRHITDKQAVKAILELNGLDEKVKLESIIRKGKDNRVTELLLSSMEISDLPPELGRLNKLKKLDLSKNNLRRLPWELELLEDLEYLDVSGNDLAVLPPETGKATALKYLDVSNNKLIALPEELGLLNRLETVIADNNRIAALPEQMSKLGGLKKLHLKDNRLSKLPKGIVNISPFVILNQNSLCNLSNPLQDWVTRYSKNFKWRKRQHCGSADTSLVDWPWKLSLKTTKDKQDTLLFNLVEDPEEHVNEITSQQDVFKRLRTQLWENAQKADMQAEVDEIKNKCRDRIRALASAIHMYKLKKGAYPETLADVGTGGFLGNNKEALVCPVTMKQYRYTKPIGDDENAVLIYENPNHLSLGDESSNLIRINGKLETAE